MTPGLLFAGGCLIFAGFASTLAIAPVRALRWFAQNPSLQVNPNRALVARIAGFVVSASAVVVAALFVTEVIAVGG